MIVKRPAPRFPGIVATAGRMSAARRGIQQDQDQGARLGRTFQTVTQVDGWNDNNGRQRGSAVPYFNDGYGAGRLNVSRRARWGAETLPAACAANIIPKEGGQRLPAANRFFGHDSHRHFSEPATSTMNIIKARPDDAADAAGGEGLQSVDRGPVAKDRILVLSAPTGTPQNNAVAGAF